MTHVVMFPGNNPLIVAIDITATMRMDAVTGKLDMPWPHVSPTSRLAAAKGVLRDLVGRLPHDTPVTVLIVGGGVGILCADEPGQVARERIALASIHNATEACAHGEALEYALHKHLRPRFVNPDPSRVNGLGYYEGYSSTPANFVLVTDAEPEQEALRWEAYSDLNAKYGSPLTITVLTCGECKPSAFECGASSSRVMAAPLNDVEIRLSVPTGSDRPGDVELAKRPTVPPSLSPPVSRPPIKGRR